ncbi:17079_t:CDS:2, partial [Funneliformis caledonium]
VKYKTHPEATYTSRLLNFNNLPEPKNSVDYYKQYNDISCMKYSESLNIDFTELKINGSDKMEIALAQVQSTTENFIIN